MCQCGLHRGYANGSEYGLKLTGGGDQSHYDGLSATFDATSAAMTGAIIGSISGEPESFDEDTQFEITVKAQEVNNASYNNERTLTITILEDVTYVSPS